MADALDYRALFENAPGLYLILDKDLKIVSATAAYDRVTGLNWNELSGTPYFDVLDREIARRRRGESHSLRESFARVLETRRRDIMPTQRFDLPSPGGGLEERYWSVRNVPILNTVRQVTWIVHRIRDVTQEMRDETARKMQLRLMEEQEELIGALRAANRELASVERHAGDAGRLGRLNTIALMTSSLAHDLSQPLTSAANFLAAFRRTNGGSAANLAYTEQAERQVQRASAIVKSLRDFVTDGRVRHSVAKVCDLVNDSAVLGAAALEKAGASLAVDLEPGLPDVAVDATQIKQVIVNLLTNACEALQNRPVRSVCLRARRGAGQAVRIDVSDTGPGLGDDAAKVFEPFRTTKTGGMGLGLSICREIVRAHRGDIWLERSDPAGATFSLTLPAAAP